MATETTLTKEWQLRLPWTLIRDASSRHGLDPYVVAAIIQQESKGVPYAYRYEPLWKYHLGGWGSWRVVAANLFESADTEEMGHKTSWGLMQVMGTVAREHGFRGWFPELCDPKIGIEYGCIHLKGKFVRYGFEEDAIAAYNQGDNRKVNGFFANQKKYVDPVYKYLRELRKIK